MRKERYVVVPSASAFRVYHTCTIRRMNRMLDNDQVKSRKMTVGTYAIGPTNTGSPRITLLTMACLPAVGQKNDGKMSRYQRAT